ncbi:hypothetical protein WJX79_005154 [Trebouxia sp. C0005]
MKVWLQQQLAEYLRRLHRQLKLLRQRAYATGLTPLRKLAQPPMVHTQDPWKAPPTAAPLKSLHDLLSWQAVSQPFNGLLRATVPLPKAKTLGHQPDRPRLLVCHDLHGNYHSDALPQGNQDSNYYRLTQWSSIDTFVYFSHALVTIPPPGWINAAHSNAVPILGTFITEWESGSLLCELLLWTEQSAEAGAMQLAQIAAYYGFDGWLLNIENPVLQRLIPNLIHFIRVLRKVMHEMVPGSQVVWYDAVTTEGILEWQDTVNDLNLPFFEAADAIFINYTWKEDTPAQAAAVAGARKHDVYMGVDVFGRNTYGGGGMTCDIALTAARSAGLSAALFAPAWVWEVGNRLDWLQRQQQFWDKIEACWEAPRALVCQLPFSTCFDQGAGSARHSEGKMQSHQPCDFAFRSGSCLQIKGSVAPGASASVQIFTADLLIPEPGLHVNFTYQPPAHPTPTHLELWCWMEPSNTAAASASAASSSHTQGTARMLAMLQPHGVCLVSPDVDTAHIPLERFEARTVQHSTGWLTLYYRLPSHLPDYAHLTLRSIEVAAVTPIKPDAVITSADNCLGYVGQIDLTEWDSVIQAPSISKISFSNVLWTAASTSVASGEEHHASASEQDPNRNPSVSGSEAPEEMSQQDLAQAKRAASVSSTDTAKVIWLYVTLGFPPVVVGTVSKFEVFYRLIDPASCKADDQVLYDSNQDWIWLGTASAHQFRVTQLEIPVSVTAVDFAVQAADVLGKLVLFQNATKTMLERP